MRKLKLSLDNPNYMSIANTHIFINFNSGDLETLNSLNPKSIEKVHIFITTHAAINMTLKLFIEKYRKMMIDGQEHRVKIIIHLPHQVKDLTYLAKKFLGWEQNGYKLIVERQGPRFNISGPRCSSISYPNYLLNITYGEHSLMINTVGSRTSCPVMVKFPEHPYNVTDKDNDPGIFETSEMRITPELFKDKLIEGFKKNCPEGILKTFKSDEDIWDYIMEKGSWGNGLPLGAVPIDFSDITPIKGPSGMKVGIVGCGQSPISQVLTALGHKDIGDLVVGDELVTLDGNGNRKVALVIGGPGMTYPTIQDLPKIPEPPQFPEMEYLGSPRNRAERRVAKKRK